MNTHKTQSAKRQRDLQKRLFVFSCPPIHLADQKLLMPLLLSRIARRRQCPWLKEGLAGNFKGGNLC